MKNGDTIKFGNGYLVIAHVEGDQVYYVHLHTPMRYPPEGPPVIAGNYVRILRHLGAMSEFTEYLPGFWERRHPSVG